MIPYHYLKTALKKKGCEPLKKALSIACIPGWVGGGLRIWFLLIVFF